MDSSSSVGSEGMPISTREYQLFPEDLSRASTQSSPPLVSLPLGYRSLSLIMSGVASNAQSSVVTPPSSFLLPSLGLSPLTPGSSITVTSVPVQPTVCVASSSISTTVVIPGGLTFEEYLLAVQQQNSQGSQ